MAESCSNLVRDIHPQIEKSKQNSNRINPNKFIPRQIIIKPLKDKEKVMKAARQNTLPIG